MVGTAEQSGKLYTKGEYFCLLGLCWCGALSRSSGAVSCCWKQPGNSCPFPQPVKPFVSWFAASGASLVAPEQFSREKKAKSSGSGCSGLAAATLELEQILTTFVIILKWCEWLNFLETFFDSEICSFFHVKAFEKWGEFKFHPEVWGGCVHSSVKQHSLEDFNSSNWAAAITSPAFSKSYLWSNACLSS